MERETGVEPATSSLGSWHSTTELLPLAFVFNNFWRLLRILNSKRTASSFYHQFVEAIHHIAPALDRRLSIHVQAHINSMPQLCSHRMGIFLHRPHQRPVRP